MEPNLEILPPPKSKLKKDKYDKINHHLFKPDFIYIIYGPCHSGKSYVLNKMITDKNFYKGVFSQIIMISATISHDETLKDINRNDNIIKITSGLNKLDEIMESIIELRTHDMEMGPVGKMLIVFDDCIQYLHERGFINGWISTFRHYKCSLIFTTQSFKKLPTSVRALTSGYLLFRTNNKKEKTDMIDEVSESFPNSFTKIYEQVTAKKFQFLFIDMKSCKLYKNFTTLLYDADTYAETIDKYTEYIDQMRKSHHNVVNDVSHDNTMVIAKKHLDEFEYLKLLYYKLKNDHNHKN